MVSSAPVGRAGAPSAAPGATRYVPTGCLALLRALEARLPRHELLIADFSELPPPTRLSGGDSAGASTGAGAGAGAGTAGLVREREVLAYAPCRGAARRTAPLCAGGAVDHATYLHAPHGAADVLFATDFALLRRMVQAVRREGGGLRRARLRGRGATAAASAAGTIVVEPSSAFLARNADTELTATRSGYNPLLSEFANTAFLHT